MSRVNLFDFIPLPGILQKFFDYHCLNFFAPFFLYRINRKINSFWNILAGWTHVKVGVFCPDNVSLLPYEVSQKSWSCQCSFTLFSRVVDINTTWWYLIFSWPVAHEVWSKPRRQEDKKKIIIKEKEDFFHIKTCIYHREKMKGVHRK